jgi:hypothetical protein
MDSLGDEARRQRIVEAAHRDIVASGRYTYRAMVEDVEHVALGDAAPVPRARRSDRFAQVVNRVAERFAWAHIAYVLRWQSRRPFALMHGVLGRLSTLVPTRGRRREREDAGTTKTIVSVTPIAVERDSRTYKTAASMARLGHRSIVVEAAQSVGLRDDLPFELITVGAPASAPTPAASPDGAPTKSATEAPPPTFLGRMAARAPDPIYRVAAPPWRAALRLVVPLALFASHNRAMAAALPSADVYYLHSQYHFPAVWWRGRAGRRPYVYDAHDLYWTLRHDGRPLPIADRAVWRMLDRVERAAARRAGACVTVGDGVAQHAEDRFGRRFNVIRNAHDTRLDTAGAPGIRTLLGLEADAFLLAVAGNFKRGMAVEPMLRALAGLPDRVHVAFIGRHYGEFATAARELGVADRMHVVPPVAPTEIVPFLAEADLAPVPYYPSSVSVRHALPNGFFLAVAAGVPVLYPSRLVDLRALAERYQVGWEFDPESDTSIRSVVERLVETPDELAECRARLRAVRDELSWEVEEQELARVIAGVLNRREAR